MKWFYDLKLSVKLITAFIIVALLSGIVGLVGITNIKKIDDSYSDLFINYGAASADIGELGMEFHDLRNTTRDIFIDRGSSDRGKYVKIISDMDKKMEQQLGVVEKSIQTDEGRRLFISIKENLRKYNNARDRAIELALANKEDQAVALFRAEAAQPALEITQAIDKMFELKTTGGKKLSDEYGATTNMTVYIMIAVIIAAMGIAVALGTFIARLISKPVNQVVEAANKIADGNLGVDVQVHTADEMGMLAAAFRRMTHNMNDVLLNISSAADQVASGSKQVSDSSMALSQGATEQASSIEELTASIEEISSQTKQNAASANQANELATAAKTIAVQGNSEMQEMLKAMAEINDSSGNISKIIKVIDEIAFQTNILALNAAVEAARAGQHGKGFAVVAEEVRNLAARSANAAKETTTMIEGSIKKVEHGTHIANETAQALGRIVEGVTDMANLVDNIAVASNEQATGIAQINQGVIQISQVVQSNSATSEETAAASEELSSQAQLLKNMINKFQLKKENTNRFSELNPDVLRLLEDMSENKKHKGQLKETNSEPVGANAIKIDLNDTGFGKY